MGTERVYYDNELVAHDAAREASHDCPMGIFVREDACGFYLSVFGEDGDSLYMAGRHSSELEDFRAYD